MHNSVRQKRPETRAISRDNTEKGGWTIAGLLWTLARHGLDPAVVAFDASGVRTWDSETVADQAWRLAHGMRQAGLGHGCAAALWAPNSPVWIVAALAVLAGSGMLVPIDDQAAPEQFEAALKTSNARFVITTRLHLEASSAVLRAHDSFVILVDDDGQTAGDARSWQSWLHTLTSTLPDPIGERRAGGAGQPLADGEMRIAEPDARGIGEIELRGSSITKGYLNNPEVNRTAFTGDGWFRTGDLGFVDRHVALFVTGHVKEVLVLGGGKKVDPEELEHIYGNAPEIAEIAVLKHDGALVALVRPDPAALYSRGATNLRDGVRVVLGEKAQRLPSYQRLSGFALISEPLPRTRLGKYRRFLLPSLYAQALGGGPTRTARAPTPEDDALLQNPIAAAVWDILKQRFPGQTLDFDTSLALDLNLDSFGWMELAIVLHERAGIALSDQDLADMRRSATGCASRFNAMPRPRRRLTNPRSLPTSNNSSDQPDRC